MSGTRTTGANAALDRAIDALGGPTRAAVKLECSTQAVGLWRRLGRVRSLRHAVLLSRLTDVPVGDLVGDGGLEDHERRQAEAEHGPDSQAHG